jgi:hypothetical protein
VLGLADWDAGLGQVGERLHQLAQTLVGGRGGLFECVRRGLELAGLLGQGGGVGSGFAHRLDLRGQAVAFRVQSFELRDGRAALLVDGMEVAQQSGGIGPAGTQFFFDQFKVGTYEGEIEHRSLFYRAQLGRIQGPGMPHAGCAPFIAVLWR